MRWKTLFRPLKAVLPGDGRRLPEVTPSSIESRDPPAVSDVRGLVAAGRLAEAEQLCLRSSQSEESGEIFSLWGYISQQTGQYDRAVTLCRRGIELGFDTCSNNLTLGYSLRAQGRHGEARAAFANALRLSPEDLDAAAYLLEATLLSEGYAQAEALYRDVSGRFEGRGLEGRWYKAAFDQGLLSQAALGTGYVVAPRVNPREWALTQGVLLLDGEEREEIPYETPPLVGADPVAFKTIVRSNRPYVAELRDVVLFSRSNIVLAEDGLALDEVGTGHSHGQFVSHQSDAVVIGQHGSDLLLQPGSFTRTHIEAGLMLSGTTTGAFGHWVPEFLTKLRFLELHPLSADLPIIVDEDMPQSHFDYLSFVAPNEIIKIGSGESVSCDRLIFASTGAFFPTHLLPNSIPVHEIGLVSPVSWRFIKSRVEASLGVIPNDGTRIYLSRRRMSWRRLSNDAEISDFLASKGFQTIYPEDLSMEEQIRVFQRAGCIVAANGSALQNIIFCDPSVSVLVLIQQNISNWGTFYGQMSALGYRPVFVCGEALGDPSEKHRDYVVPLAVLAEALERVGLDGAS